MRRVGHTTSTRQAGGGRAVIPNPGAIRESPLQGRWLLLGGRIPGRYLFALSSVSGYGACRRRNDELGGGRSYGTRRGDRDWRE